MKKKPRKKSRLCIRGPSFFSTSSLLLVKTLKFGTKRYNRKDVSPYPETGTRLENKGFYQYGKRIYEYTLKNGVLNETEVPIRTVHAEFGATKPEQKAELEKELSLNRIPFISERNYVVNPDLTEDRYTIDMKNGVITVECAPVPFNTKSLKAEQADEQTLFFSDDFKAAVERQKRNFELKRKLLLEKDLDDSAINRALDELDKREANAVPTLSYTGIDLIDRFIYQLFGEKYAPVIKLWMALHAFTNYRQLPVLALYGPRGTGKSKFAEFVGHMYPSLWSHWKGVDEKFTGYAYENHTLVIDENDTLQKRQYECIKKITGATYLQGERKFKDPYRIRNNANIILCSNAQVPMYVKNLECPTSELNNNFFVFKATNTNHTFDSKLLEKLIPHLGAYIQNVLRPIYENHTFEGRYNMRVPITKWEKQLFGNNTTQKEYAALDIMDTILDQYTVHDDYRSIEIYELLTALLNKGFLANKLLKNYLNGMNLTAIKTRLHERGILGEEARLRIGSDSYQCRGRYIKDWPELTEFIAHAQQDPKLKSGLREVYELDVDKLDNPVSAESLRAHWNLK